MEGSEPGSVTARHCGVGGVGGGERFVGEHPHDRVEVRVELLDAGQVRFHHLPARRLPGANRLRKFQCTQLPELCHPDIIAHP